MQIFFSEDVVMQGIGVMGDVVDDDAPICDEAYEQGGDAEKKERRAASRYVIFDDNVKKSNWPREIRHHVVYIAPVYEFSEVIREYLPDISPREVGLDAVSRVILPVTDDGD